MPEPIRLVIWDLDETFWKGTISEEGIVYSQANHDLVIELAKRGIVSSICSKNDHEKVKAMLVEKGIWDYFIFPSINWEPKGARVKNIVETVQLRAPTIAFLDDNPMNLNEVLHFVPDIQVFDETVIPSILEDPLYRGKDDSELSRLKQYKLLEVKKKDEQAAGTDNKEFLRTSDIHVVIDYDIEKNIDRAVELINRTNQLNFTKRRLSEDPAVACEELRALIASFKVKAALIRVYDKYGDYGYCGFYLIRGANPERLLHFCFSCRILNMGVETWLYNRLQRPKFFISGEVLLDVINDKTEVDWIADVDGTDSGALEDSSGKKLIDRLFLRGGCDLGAMAHYVGNFATEVISEFPWPTSECTFRIDHSQMLRYALEGRTLENSPALGVIGYTKECFATRLLDPIGDEERVVSLFSFWLDITMRLRKHHTEDVLIPAPVTKPGTPIPEGPFTVKGRIKEGHFKQNLRLIFSHTRQHLKVFVMGAIETITNRETGEMMALPRSVEINTWTRDVIAEFPNVTMLDIRDCIEGEHEVHSQTHFDRMVYFRAVQKMRTMLDQHLAEQSAVLTPSLV